LCACQQRNWQHSLETPEAVALSVVTALNQGDVEALHRLRVTREEYLAWIWPSFPSSKAPYAFPADFAWSNLNKKCQIGVNKWVRIYGRQDLVFSSLHFEKSAEEYKGFRLLRGTVLSAKKPNGDEIALEIIGSMVENAGRYKLLSYRD